MKIYIVRTCQSDEEVALLIERWINGTAQAELLQSQYSYEQQEWTLIFQTED